MSSNENEDPAQIAMRVRGANGQTADLFTVEQFDGTDVFKVDKDGDTTIAGDLAHTGDLDVVGNLSVSVAATLPAITGPTVLTGTLGVTGAATLPAITGPTTLTGALTQVGDVGITGVVTGTTFDEGAAEIVAGDTYVDVLHGLTITPSINKIRLTPKDDLLGRTFRITSVDASQIRITISSIDTVDHSFGWGVF